MIRCTNPAGQLALLRAAIHAQNRTATPLRMGIASVQLGLHIANPYPADGRAARSFAEGVAWAQQALGSPITPEQAPQHVLKAEAATPDATDRGVPAITSPDGGPMGAGQPAAAGPFGGA